MQIIIKSFQELTLIELHNILQLRSEVFVVEQNCVYQDIDGKDPRCHHLLVIEESIVIGYCRLIPMGVSYQDFSIGRVCNKYSVRHSVVGKLIMNNAIKWMQQNWNANAIRISGQAYLQTFYESLGFKIVSDTYLEDGIPHYEMLWCSH